MAAVEPMSTLVQGPDSEVEEMDAIETESIDVSKLAIGRHQRQVDLERPPPHTTLTQMGATVTLEVVPREAERTFEDVEVAVVGGETSARVRPVHVDVTLWGSTDQLEPIGGEDVVPYVDIDKLDLSAGAVEVPVQVRNVPDGVQVRSVPEGLLVDARTESKGRNGQARSGR